MSKREAIARYNLVIQKLRKKPATFEEISDYLDRESEFQSYDFRISKRTFQRDLNDIRSIFSIDIQFNRSQKVYFIEQDAEPEAQTRILEAFDLFHALNLSDRLSDRLLFEKRKPSGTEHLFGVLHAIKNKYCIRFVYQKFWEDERSIRLLEPFALKEFRSRWYILGKDLKDSRIKVFALDRLSELEITKQTFQFPVHFNSHEVYKHAFGIILPDEEIIEKIELSFTPFQGKYIKSLPLHESQHVLIDNDNEFRIALNMYVTHDFIMEILSLGCEVKIIEPAWLIEDVKKRLKKSLSQYEI